jgi:hypothetical protein
MFLTVAQTAEYLHVSPSWVRHLSILPLIRMSGFCADSDELAYKLQAGTSLDPKEPITYSYSIFNFDVMAGLCQSLKGLAPDPPTFHLADGRRLCRDLRLGRRAEPECLSAWERNVLMCHPNAEAICGKELFKEFEYVLTTTGMMGVKLE